VLLRIGFGLLKPILAVSGAPTRLVDSTLPRAPAINNPSTMSGRTAAYFMGEVAAGRIFTDFTDFTDQEGGQVGEISGSKTAG
jgi:hypothetical protein